MRTFHHGTVGHDVRGVSDRRRPTLRHGFRGSVRSSRRRVMMGVVVTDVLAMFRVR